MHNYAYVLPRPRHIYVNAFPNKQGNLLQQAAALLITKAKFIEKIYEYEIEAGLPMTLCCLTTVPPNAMREG